jgi:hypothetical protein
MTKQTKILVAAIAAVSAALVLTPASKADPCHAIARTGI